MDFDLLVPDPDRISACQSVPSLPLPRAAPFTYAHHGIKSSPEMHYVAFEGGPLHYITFWSACEICLVWV